MEKLSYRVGTTPIRHNGRFFDVGEPVSLTDEEAEALQDHVSLDPVQPRATAPAAQTTVQAPVVEAASANAAPQSATDTPAAAPKAVNARGRKAKTGEKA
jgi:hypothetical protein